MLFSLHAYENGRKSENILGLPFAPYMDTEHIWCMKNII